MSDSAADLRQKSLDELDQFYLEQVKELFKNRIQLATSQMNQSSKLRQLKRSIARVLTIITEKQRAGEKK